MNLVLSLLLVVSGAIQGNPEEDELGTPNINTISEWVRSEYPDLPRIQTTNCRKIAGSSTWSQHAWANAADIFVTPAQGDEIAARLQEEFGEWIRALLWRVPAHHDHIHIETWPHGTGTPPCAGGTLKVLHKDGSVGSVFTDDIPEGGDDMPITSEDAKLIAKEVWFHLITHPVTNTQRGAQALLADAVRYSNEAATRPLPTGSGPTAEEIADAVIDEIAS